MAMLYEHDDHAAARDKFVILAIHDPQAANFALLDEKLKPVVRRVWRGRALPFPILLDTTGKTGGALGVVHYPTVVLLDPAWRVVDIPMRKGSITNNHAQEFLASKLLPLPTAVRLARAPDHDLDLNVSEDRPLAELIDIRSAEGQGDVRLSERAVESSRDGSRGEDARETRS
jgi:hypothetical protein